LEYLSVSFDADFAGSQQRGVLIMRDYYGDYHHYESDYDRDCEDHYEPNEYDRLVEILNRIACIDIPRVSVFVPAYDPDDIPF
jgi:hypothetical protein